MFKYLAALMLTLICSQAFAGWTTTPFVSAHDGTYYWDADNIQYKGNNLTIWIADDFGEARISKMKPDAKYLSLKEELEINCTAAKSRVIDYIELSENRGAGTVVVQDKRKAEWTAIVPGSLSQSVMTTFCKKPAP